MFKIRIVFFIIVILELNIYGCNNYHKMGFQQVQKQNQQVVKNGISENNEVLKQKKNIPKVGMPNPAAIYCVALGYKYEIRKNKNGGQYGVCIFPDGTECDEWDFYRGIKGQKWSYCNLLGYSQKDNGYNGWISGAICIDKNTGKEIGTLKKLVVDRFSRGEPLTEFRR